jgi:3-(3-hydroxy-phenyl)propionate hydroxylase
MRAGGTEPLPDPEYDVGIFQQTADGTPIRPAGFREPQGVVAHLGREGLFDDVVGWGFTLALRDADPQAMLTPEHKALLESIRCNIVRLGREPGDGVTVELNDDYENFFATHGIVGFLSRPDFRIFAGIRAADEIPGLVDDLARQLYAT